MVPDPFLVDALYAARRRDEVRMVEIDDQLYPASGFRPVRAGQPRRVPRVVVEVEVTD
jgi:hypothetical protein